ncbi:AraC family ligand binding domain-containing protein [Streptomyces omiyaensis]|uniref:AraC family ligand binding domain-containing protein n=1 Tax=Streptomyces omiyaensis TaxID=68247 RepID=UPI001678FA10|nr:AraC family ligand binding domain-containing protein [Streptomyces omiyaensis]
MDARFDRYAHPTHARDTYAFGVTDHGAQSFVCRGGRHVSAAGPVMVLDPDDPHDGRSAVRDGDRYRMLHLGEAHVRDAWGDAAPGAAGPPLFAAPVVDEPAPARAGARPHAAVAGNAPRPAGAPATAAAEAGFAGQAPLTRWFTHTYGITPAAYRTA